MSKKVDDVELKKALCRKMTNETRQGLDICQNIIETLKKYDYDEFKDLDPHFLFQYYETYLDINKSCDVLHHYDLVNKNLVSLILMKFIKQLRSKYEDEWNTTNKKIWFDFIKDNLEGDQFSL